MWTSARQTWIFLIWAITFAHGLKCYQCVWYDNFGDTTGCNCYWNVKLAAPPLKKCLGRDKVEANTEKQPSKDYHCWYGYGYSKVLKQRYMFRDIRQGPLNGTGTVCTGSRITDKLNVIDECMCASDLCNGVARPGFDSSILLALPVISIGVFLR